MNKYGVGALGDKVIILLPPREAMSREDAIELAAWLTVIAFDDGEKVLAKIKELIS